MGRVSGKVAIVTGSATGLGKAQAKLLAKEGAKVVVTDINDSGGKQTAEEIVKGGGEAIFIKHDVTHEKDWEAVIKETLATYGKLDVLVNNAGIVLPKAIEETSLEEWRRVMAVNLDGIFLGTKQAIPAMKDSGRGSIVNLSSIGGLIGMRAETSSYIASKGGVRLFTKATAIECSKAVQGYNIRVNSVHPGFILTEMLERVMREDAERNNTTYAEAKQKRELLTPLGQLGDPDDVAYAVLYLASDESKFVTGAEFVVDGGFTAC